MRRALAVLCSLFVVLPARAAAPGAEPSAPSAPVVVAVVVDQLAAWVAAERLPALPDGGGFARLRREGTWVRELRFLHAITETAPGHAALFTGRTPRENAIVANQVVREDLPGRPVATLVQDPVARLTGTAKDAPAASLGRLDGDTLADALVARDPAAVVVSFSLKDRGVVFAAGRRPRLAAWYDDDGQGGAAWVSSSAFPALPAWLAGRGPDVSRTSPLVWELTDRDFVERHAATADDQAGEAAEDHGRRTFPYAIAAAPSGRRAFRTSPLADDLLVDLSLEAVARERDPAHPMLLTVSLSGLDYVGHEFGPDSWEHWDALLRVDRALGRLLDGLDRAVGPGGYTVVLSADHGVAPLPEVVATRRPAWCAAGARDRWQRPCEAGVRVTTDAIRDTLDAAIAEALHAAPGPKGRFVEAFVDPLVYLGPEAKAALPGARATIDRAVRAAARTLPGVAAVLPVPARPCPGPGDEGQQALVCRATRPGTGDFYVVVSPGSFFWGDGPGTSHGSPYLYDRAVPLLVRGPGVARGRVVERGTFGSYRATAWWALTGEASRGPYGGVVR